MRTTRRLSPTIGIAVAGTALALTGCSSGTSTSAQSPSPSPSAPTASPTETGRCSSEAILAVLPEGATMVRFDCESVEGTQWAAAEVEPGPTVFFLQESGDTWNVSTSDEVCGTASAGLPPKLLDYCTAPSASASS